MEVTSFNDQLEFNENKIVTKVILESSFSKEIRILLKKGQIMKEHKTAFPITVHILEGAIDFGALNKVNLLTKGAIVSLDGNVPHDLTAKEDSIVRLTLSKLDNAQRVEKVAENS